MTRSAEFKSKLNDGDCFRSYGSVSQRGQSRYRRFNGNNLWLEVVLLPFQTIRAGLGKESNLSPAIDNLPMLVRVSVIELDCRCPFDFKPAELVKRHSLCP